MIKICICFLLLFFVQEEPVMVWQENYKLQWTDFNGKPNIGGSAAATTASGITFSFSIKEENGRVVDLTTSVRACFYPEQSWFKREHATTHVLGHERLHFDITELYARKFRQRIQNLRLSNNIKKQLKEEHKNIQKELQNMQNMYDAETNFSREPINQIKWQKLIASELNKLSSYKDAVAY